MTKRDNANKITDVVTRSNYIREAEEILTTLKSLGFVQLAKDQSLPGKNPNEPSDSDYNYKYWAFGDVCADVQRDMITPKDGYAFRRVKVE